MDKDKQIKSKFASVNTNRTNYFADNENIFNSTARIPGDLLSNEADISSITSIYPDSGMSSKPVTSNTNDINIKQIELDCLYMQYMTILSMRETLKKSFKDEEENFIKDMLDLHRCSETLKKTCVDLEYESKLVRSLSEIVEFMDATIQWIDSNSSELASFQANFKKLADLCSRANKFLKIENIYMPSDLDFEEGVAAELRKTISILSQMNNFYDEKCVIQAPEKHSDDTFDYDLFKELKKQYEKLKICLLQHDMFKLMEKQ